MPFRVLHDLSRWYHASLTHRIKASALVLMLGMAIVIGAVSFVGMRVLLAEKITQEMGSVADLFAQHVELHLEGIAADVQQLAGSSLLANALVDSQGREIYLTPHLREYRTGGKEPLVLCLHDFLGRVITCQGHSVPVDAEHAPWRERVLSNNVHTEVLAPNRLMLAYPVIFRATGQPEGLLVAVFDLEQLLDIDQSRLRPDWTIRIGDGRHTFLCFGCDRELPDDVVYFSRALRLPPTLQELGLEIEVGSPQHLTNLPLATLTYAYLAAAVLVALLAWWGVGVMARRLSARLGALADSADRVTATGGLDAVLDVHGNDEVARLAKSLQAMLSRVRDATENLEHRVEERTAELAQRERDLRAQRNEYFTIFESVPAMVWYVDAEGRVLRANGQVAAYLQRPVEEIQGRLLTELFPAAVAARIMDGNRQVIETGKELLGIVGPGFAGGWFRSDRIPFRDADGRLLGVTAFVTDVSEQTRAEEHMRLASAVFDNSREGIIIVDAHARILAVNRAFSEITGYSADEVMGQTPHLLASGRHGREFYAGFWSALIDQGEWRGEIWNRRKNGEIYPERLSAAAVRNEKGDITHYVGVFADITGIKETEKRLENLAYFDPLTGLANRALFMDRLANAVARRRREETPLALLFIDLDRFKVINDSLGHDAGDSLLRHIAAELRTCVREDDSVARLGGDEFTVLLEQPAGRQGVAQIAQRILSAISRPIAFGEDEIYSGASIGIAMYPDDGLEAETLLKNADAAMYRAKSAGRNTFVFYTAEMNAGSHQELRLQSELRRAIDRDELELWFQPQYDLATGQFDSAEVLVRWNHPTRGRLMPADFLPTASESGLIVALDRWVLRHTCRLLETFPLRADGRKLKLAVNLSSERRLMRDLADDIDVLLGECTVGDGRLELEFTETSFIHSTSENISLLKALRARGIRIAIDDFGTGYSSLLYLKRFPIDVLKIDQSFVAGLPDDVEDASIVEAILAMAAAFDLEVIAEGVETAAQAEFLRARQCHRVQGFFFARPVNLERLLAMWAGDHPAGEVA